MLATAGFSIAWLAIAQTDEVVIATGILEPLGSVKDIQVPVGIVQDILVTEGQQVKAGQILLRMDIEADLDRRKSVEENLELKQKQLTLKQEERFQYLQLNSTEQEVLRENLELQQELLSRYRELAEQGASPEIQLLQQVDRVQQVEGQLEKLSVERMRQKLF